MTHYLFEGGYTFSTKQRISFDNNGFCKTDEDNGIVLGTVTKDNRGAGPHYNVSFNFSKIQISWSDIV